MYDADAGALSRLAEFGRTVSGMELVAEEYVYYLFARCAFHARFVRRGGSGFSGGLGGKLFLLRHFANDF